MTTTIGHATYQPGVKGSHGNPVDAWAEPVDVQVYGYGPRTDTRGATGSNEPGGTQVVVGLEVYAPKGLAVDPRDRFVVDGKMYNVEGEIGDWSNGPYGFAPGIVIALKRAEGGR